MACAEAEANGTDGMEPEGNGVVRRPMNAFLIFCKRHRSLVKAKYPHMENRSITKILGEWWASLEADEKVTYTDLAKQYKEAFMRANPNFRWYKLPTTPQTLVTRPSNQRSSKADSISHACFPLPNKCGITPGKLADETQLGGLNSLITQPSPQSSSDASSTSLLSKPPKKRYLQSGEFLICESNGTVCNSDPQTSSACSALLELASMCSSRISVVNSQTNDTSLNPEPDSSSNDLKCLPESYEETYNFKEKETKVSHQQLINCIIENSIGSNSQDGVRMNGTGMHLFKSEQDNEDEIKAMEADGYACRKSERKGKGNRYQALLSEGILQPPKDRRNATYSARKANSDYKNDKGKGKAAQTMQKSNYADQKSKSLNLDAQIAALPRCNFDILVKKRKKSDSSEFNDDRCYSDSDPIKDPDFKPSSGTVRLVRQHSETTTTSDEISLGGLDENEEDDDSRTKFQTGDFDLEKQIAALPSLNFDLLNQRKKQQRHKSAAGSRHSSRAINKAKVEKRHSSASNHKDDREKQSTGLSGATMHLVGSQKRKARKRSITHLDPTSHKPNMSVVEPFLLDTLSTNSTWQPI